MKHIGKIEEGNKNRMTIPNNNYWRDLDMLHKCVECNHTLIGDKAEYLYNGHIAMTVIGGLIIISINGVLFSVLFYQNDKTMCRFL